MRDGASGAIEATALSPGNRGSPGPRPSLAELGAAIDGWRTSWRHQMNDHPARSLALAIGAGYLLGGGLFSRLTGRLLGVGMRVGLRLVALPLAAEAVGILVSSSLAERRRVEVESGGSIQTAAAQEPSRGR